MPSVAQEQHASLPAGGKKRRRDDDGNAPEIYLGLYDGASLPWAADRLADHHFPRSSARSPRADDGDNYDAFAPSHDGQTRPSFLASNDALARKMMPLPTAKRMRMVAEEDERTRSRFASPLKSRSPLNSTPAREELQETSANSRPSPNRVSSAALLSRCHICHRKPTKKADLDSYADCEGCGQRTCFICIRECQGWGRHASEDIIEEQDHNTSFEMADADEIGWAEQEHRTGGGYDSERQRQTGSGWIGRGHQRRVCSRCCVERGSDGDAVCLGCLRFVDG